MILRAASAGAWVVAFLWWWVVPVRKGVAVDNLRASLPDEHPRRVLTRMMHDLVLGYVEMLRFGSLRITVEGASEVPPGSILLGGHGGSWDVALLAWAEHIPLAIFLRTPTNPWVRDRLAALRRAHDVEALETGARMPDAYAMLERGRSVFFIQDQRHHKGIDSPFFGRAAKTSTGLAAAVQKTGRPVFAAWQWREGVGRHRLRIERLPVRGDTQAVTDAANAWYEARIREHPHGWLWLHRRWR